MAEREPKINPSALQDARAALLRELFEPWSLRRLETRTGIGRGTLETRFNGRTALTMSDIEVLAPVIRMTPEELFSELRAVKPSESDGSEARISELDPERTLKKRLSDYSDAHSVAPVADLASFRASQKRVS